VTIQIRRVTVDDWQSLRELRLEALEDTPLGFLETLEAARAVTDQDWQARTARSAKGAESFQVLAWDGRRAVGTCRCFVRDGVAWLAAVYVSPPYRGNGLLARLADACAEWARAQGLTTLRLEVHEDNARAQAAYGKLGFVETGQRQPYPLDPGGDELVMERSL
jgi:ribosomal protein S18 acetylase RimI-like enzyme